MADLAERNTETMREQDLFSKIPYHAIFTFLIPLLVAVLQASVQCSIKSLFETHPINMYTFLLSTIIYCLSFAAHIKCKLQDTSNSHDQSDYFDELFSAFAIISGSLSSVALVSVLLPRLLGLIIFIALAILVFIVVAYRHPTLVNDTYNWLHQKIKETSNWLQQKFMETSNWLQKKIQDTYVWLYQKVNSAYDWLHQKICDKISILTEQQPPV